MLSPDTRRVLLEALRPPPGFRIDRAIATTYSLDLMALLTAPLAFSLFDGMSSADGAGRTDDVVERMNPLALLEAARSYAERTTVFCQSAQISAPPKFQRLLTYLEESVVEVNAPSPSGVFHPKLWALRMVGDEEQVAYRVLCSSRNLTFDPSWDTLLVLDGELTGRERAFAANRPLADFFAALPSLAVTPPKARVLESIALVSEELARVRFELPHPFDELSFHPMGIGRYTKPPIPESKRALIVSPFVSATALEAMAEGGVLVSRAEELANLSAEALAPFEVHVLHDGAELLEDGETEASSGTEFRPPPTGLHAKLVVQDDGWNAHVWTGSMNATNAALHQNVEFMVQLTGKKSQVGIDAFLDGRKGEAGLRTILSEWAPNEAVEGDSAVLALEERLTAVRRVLARTRWTARVDPGPEGATWSVRLRAEGALPLEALGEVRVELWPISVPRDTFARTANVGEGGLSVEFAGLSYVALTSFFAVSLSLTDGEHLEEQVFVVNARLENAPANRAARVLQDLLDDPAKVLRFLRMLLAAEPFEALGTLAQLGEGGPGSLASGPSGSSEAPLLEAMVRALHQDPSRLDAIALVVRDLLSTEEGRRLLPPTFLDAWEPVWQARLTIGKGVAA